MSRLPRINVLDKGFVRLDACMADDLSVVNAARVSLQKRSEWDNWIEQTLAPSDEGLISFLLKNHHGTPFEHNSFRWHIKCPIFVAREWMRHRIGSFNEISGRYSELKEEFYVPEYVRTQVGKPGAYTFEPVDEYESALTREDIRWLSVEAFRRYHKILERGVAKEVARVLLPVGTYTEFYWTLNARSLMNFLNLRNSEFAQYEIREYADAVESMFSQIMPVTHKAFVENDRLAP